VIWLLELDSRKVEAEYFLHLLRTLLSSALPGFFSFVDQVLDCESVE